MSKLLHSLISLGLSDKEAKIYLALYKLGEATAYQVAKESGIKRPTVYILMEELRKRGLALVIPYPKKQVFAAKEPHEFIREYQSNTARNTNDFLSLLPKLSRPSADIIVFKGEGALSQGLTFGIHNSENKDAIAFYTGVKKGSKVRDEYTGHFTEFYKNGYKLRCLTPSDSHDEDFREDDKKYGFKTKKISSDIFSPPVSTEVFGEYVKFIFHKKNEVIVIKDKGLVTFYMQMFNYMWNQN